MSQARRNLYERMRYHRQRWHAQSKYIFENNPPTSEPIYRNAHAHMLAYARYMREYYPARAS